MPFKVTFVLVISAIRIMPALSQVPGNFDPTYGINGLKVLPVGIANAFSRDVAMQADGKAMVASIANNGTDTDFAVVRFTTAGEPDTTWGDNGIVLTDFNAKTDIAEGIVIDGMERVIVAGYTDNGNGFDFAVARYLPDGQLDESFGEDGLVTTFMGFTGFCKTAAVQSDNKIILGGFALNSQSGFNEFALVRFNTDGTPDSTFDADGIVMTNFGIGAAVANDMLIQPDGKIVLAGQVLDESTFLWNIGIARYTESGSLDETFDEDGIALTETQGGNYTVNAVALQADQKIVVGGFHGTAPSNNLFAVSRYHEDGTLDDSFGTHGLVIDSYGAQDNQITTMAIQPDGQILVAGTRLVGNADQFALARLDPLGAFDETFGSDGIVTNVVGQNDGISAIALQSDGKLVAAGESFNGTRFELVAARYETGLMTHTDEPVHAVTNTTAYPNPVRNELTLSYTLEQPSSVQIRLYDATGRFITTFEGINTPTIGLHEETIQLPSHLAGGIYWLALQADAETTIAKLVVSGK